MQERVVQARVVKEKSTKLSKAASKLRCEYQVGWGRAATNRCSAALAAAILHFSRCHRSGIAIWFHDGSTSHVSTKESRHSLLWHSPSIFQESCTNGKNMHEWNSWKKWALAAQEPAHAHQICFCQVRFFLISVWVYRLDSECAESHCKESMVPTSLMGRRRGGTLNKSIRSIRLWLCHVCLLIAQKSVTTKTAWNISSGWEAGGNWSRKPRASRLHRRWVRSDEIIFAALTTKDASKWAWHLALIDS